MPRSIMGTSPGPSGLVPDGRTPLVVAAVRRRVVIAIGVAAAITGVLAWRYAGDSGAGRADTRITEVLDDQPGIAHSLARGFAALGGPLPVVVALLLLAPLAWYLRRGRGLGLVLAGPTTAMVVTSLVLKPLVERTRGGELAFPSGHTTSVASIAVTCAVLVLGLPTLPRALRLLAVAGLAALVVAVGVSLVVRGIHYPTDTLGALGVAVAVVLGVALAVDAFADVVSDPGPDPRAFDPREKPTDVLPRVGSSPEG
ncbi:phosphatase PAP2 family protein [Actinomycetospora sp. C-140]